LPVFDKFKKNCVATTLAGTKIVVGDDEEFIVVYICYIIRDED
jgi:hypothetical protein